MALTFFFYDLETTGLNPRSDRIMQFAGQRTDMNLKPIGDPVNELIILPDDTIPSPGSLMVTGITPQKTVEDGWKEADFCHKLINEWFSEDTIIVGFNNVRFDDEFIRYLLWRNFHDPYEWSWDYNRSRWDMLDVVRMTRALRPEGISWPVDDSGAAVNNLAALSTANNIDAKNAHDALSDVMMLIEITKLIKQKQPQLFDYLLKMRFKDKIQELINLDNKQPFVYTSGRYDKDFNKTTVALPLTTAPHKNVMVYDLRIDPQPFVDLSIDELKLKINASWEERQQPDFVALPIKKLQYNRCPAVAPIGVLESQDGWQKIQLDKKLVTQNMKKLLDRPDFSEKIRTIYEEIPPFESTDNSPEAKLYDGFLMPKDKRISEAIQLLTDSEVVDFQPSFYDDRLPELWLHYKARNYNKFLSKDEISEWQKWRKERLAKQLDLAMKDFETIEKNELTREQVFVMSELKLWIANITSDHDND